MKTTKTIIFPALLALSMFGATHAYAGDDVDKNGPPPGEPDQDTKGPDNPDTPTPPPDNHTKVDPPPDNHTKVDPPPEPTPPPKPTPPGPTPTDPDKKHTKRLVCVIGDQRFYVRYRSECVGPRVVYREPRVVYKRQVKRVRTVRYAAPCNCAAPVVTYGRGRGDIVIGGGYASSGTRFIGSPAAVAQARKRAAYQLQFGGGVYDGGYAYGNGVGYDEEQAPVVVRRHAKRNKLRVRRAPQQVYYSDYPSYNPGVVIHYGPAIMKDGAY